MLYIEGKTPASSGMGLAVSRDGQITVQTEKRHMPFAVLTGIIFCLRPRVCHMSPIRRGGGDFPTSFEGLFSSSVETSYGFAMMVGTVPSSPFQSLPTGLFVAESPFTTPTGVSVTSMNAPDVAFACLPSATPSKSTLDLQTTTL